MNIYNQAQHQQPFHHLDFNPNWAFARNNNQFSHGYHRYPAKFIHSIAHKLIKENSVEGDLVCDPFGGCGTTLLEAKLTGRQSIGFDINPIAKLITEVKTKAIHPKKLNHACQMLNERILFQDYIKADYSNTHERIKYWFNEACYSDLQHIYYAILNEQNSHIQQFFICAFSHCLKNASRWLMKSIKPTIDKNKIDIDIRKNFIRHLKMMANKNDLLYATLKEHHHLNSTCKIYLTNILNLKKNVSVDLIVTSPPYVTSYEYADLHQLTLLWLGHHQYKGWQKYLNNFKTFKRDFIGSSISIKQNIVADLGSALADDIVNDLAKVDKSLMRKVKTYFAKMYLAYHVMYELLKKGKKACFVIGNTKLKGIAILNAEVAYQQLLNIGFSDSQIIKRNAMANKMVAPYRDKTTGKFTSIHSKHKTVAYHEEYIIEVVK